MEALQGAVPEHAAAGDLHLATVRVGKEGIGRGGLGPALDRVEGAPSIREVRLEARGQNPDLATGIPSQVVDPHLRQACGRPEGQGGEFQKAQVNILRQPYADAVRDLARERAARVVDLYELYTPMPGWESMFRTSEGVYGNFPDIKGMEALCGYLVKMMKP